MGTHHRLEEKTARKKFLQEVVAHERGQGNMRTILKLQFRTAYQ